jgi:rubrerythrin
MAEWKCPDCGFSKDSRCKPKKCPTCDKPVAFEKREAPPKKK